MLKQAEERLDMSKQFTRLKRLRQINIGACLDTNQFISQFIARCQHHHRNILLSLSYTTTDFQPIYARQHNIENDQINLLHSQDGQRLLSVLRRYHSVTRSCQ